VFACSMMSYAKFCPWWHWSVRLRPTWWQKQINACAIIEIL